MVGDKLKAVLCDVYDGFADKRIKKSRKGKRFIVDGRRPNDTYVTPLWACVR